MQNQFLDNENNPVTPEKWQWVVLYADQTTLQQFDYETGIYHYFKEIDQSKVVRFGLVNREDGKTIFKDIPQNAKLIHYYDNIIQHPLGGLAIRHRLYCIGFELGKEKLLWTVLPTNVVVEGKIDNLELL